MNVRNWTLIALVPAALIVLALQFFLSSDGQSSMRACGWGWGAKHKRVQTRFLAAEFKEPLPQSLVLTKFECTGFQDLEVTADFEIRHADGLALVAALDRTYAEPQNSEYFKDSEKKRLETAYPDKRRFKYTLPANQTLYVLDLEVFVPSDISKPVTVKFEGYQY